MEPLSIAVISGAVGGVAGQLTVKAWESSEKWLSTYLQDHQPKAIKKAEQNSLMFLADLSQRVSQLESTASNPEYIKQRIISALEDPDFSLLFKDALLVSARTENEDIHKVLGRIVSERLRCESDDLLAYTIPLACGALKSLTPRQLRFLAVGAILEQILPKQALLAKPKSPSQFCIDLFNDKLPSVLPENDVTHLDLRHLVSVGCINLIKTLAGGTNLGQTLQKTLKLYDASIITGIDKFFDRTDVGKRLFSCWKRKLSHTMLTTSGLLIGLCVFDELTGEQTDVKLYIP